MQRSRRSATLAAKFRSASVSRKRNIAFIALKSQSIALDWFAIGTNEEEFQIRTGLDVFVSIIGRARNTPGKSAVFVVQIHHVTAAEPGLSPGFTSSADKATRSNG